MIKWVHKRIKPEVLETRAWNHKEYSEQELKGMPTEEFNMLKRLVRWKCWNMLGFTGAREVHYWQDKETGSYHFKWR